MHDDNDPVLLGYSSSRNISFRDSGDELGVTWGEWRAMTEGQRRDAIDEYVYELIDVWVEDDEN